MSLQVEKLEHNMAKLTIEVSNEDFEKAVEKAYQKNKNKISVPGFRKGKVPRQMMEKMYGKEVFFEDAANIIIPDAYEKAYDECEEEIVSSPKIDVVQLEGGKPFIFTAEVALNPEITLGKYKGVEVAKVETEVTEEEMNAKIDKDRDEQSRSVSVERPVQDGDTTVIDFEGFVDGEAFEGGKGENYSLTIGSGSFIPGFEEQLIGKKIEEECEVNVSFPEDYQAKELAGKPAVFKCKIHEIKEKQIPELDADFADDAGFDSVEAYKEDVKKKLAEKKAEDAKTKKEDEVIEAIVSDATMDIPAAMIETQQRQMVEEFAQQLSMQGLSLEQYFMFTGMTKETMLEQTKPRAEKRIQARLAMEAVAKAENMEASEADVDKEITEMAEKYKMEFDQLKGMIGESDMKQMKKDIVIKKAIDFVVENAKEK
ncbi:MAG TPA: trigger factor [Lachnospiraceae bacterium]|nr:trigger factor [Lachnospiraceae bacterium]